ncbi:O-methyltransferase family protein [Plectosphaerella cucumerina]|uniref:O-methyltransferase family protein n=1 Tax=Plectosphaerella cucumerina TaxID=40658 RepID=A0A8K0TRZ0_9PEZI|nr:O-methyltransferase family protein [Plectosphaerella cucumerina]
MKSNAPVLYPNEQVTQRVTDYSSEHSTPLPQHIVDYHARIVGSRADSNLMISDFQAQNHIWLAKLIGAKRVLEIGVYVGYSALVWSHAVGPEGSVTGLEFSEDYAKLARESFAETGVSNIEVVVGDALETLPALNPAEPYDLIFIDANKSGYPKYLETILERSAPGSSNRILRPGGLIVADNVLRRGIVADDSDNNPWVPKEKNERAQYGKSTDIELLRVYNKIVIESPRLDVFLLPLFDGVNLARLVD